MNIKEKTFLVTLKYDHSLGSLTNDDIKGFINNHRKMKIGQLSGYPDEDTEDYIKWLGAMKVVKVQNFRG